MTGAAALDHLVIAAADLAEGRAWAERMLGVPAGGGGVHALMGTHNALWKLGDAYLEVIAVDPSAPDPGRPRWFSLDDPAMRARIAERPRLVTWQVRPKRGLDAALEGLGVSTGPALAMARDELTWRLTVPEDGVMPFGGLFPVLIEWSEGVPRPPERLPENGLRLRRLVVRGGGPELDAALGRIGARGLVAREEGAPGLVAEIEGPGGVVTLD